MSQFDEWVRSGSSLIGGDLPEAAPLPRWLAPLPRWLEDFGLQFALVIALVNFVGTAFGFWYYGIHPFSKQIIFWQFAHEPVVMWPFVPDSPVATLFIGLSLATWKLGHSNEYINALGFFGCIQLGLWTPFVLLTFHNGFISEGLPMYSFLVCSHLAMAVEAFLVYRYSNFPIRAATLAVVWYTFNDIVDYFIPIVGTPHHTLLPGQLPIGPMGYYTHPVTTHRIAAAGAIVLTVLATFLMLATRIKKLELGWIDGHPESATDRD